ncbi:MAG: membrane protein insertase YidC [Deltaproteobacteria bacterium]|jgi:YidC/Oxa1 family membrane protein insertase|nr:membrane protein insertase YidC [Deltaproteobacteria bacterium]
MDKRVVVTMLVMMGFFMLVSYIYPVIFPPPPRTPAPATEAPAAGGVLGVPVAPAGQAGEAAPAGDAAGLTPAQPGGGDAAPAPPRRVRVETPEYSAVFTEEGGRLVSFKLKRYKSWEAAGEEAESFQELVNRPVQADPSLYPMNLVYLPPDGGPAADLRGVLFQADADALEVPPGGRARLVFTPRERTSGLAIERVYEFTAGSYTVGQELRLSNAGAVRLEGRIGVSVCAWPFSERQNRYNVMAGFINRKLVTETVDDAASELDSLRLITSADFLGYMDQYFLTALVFGDQPAPGRGQEAGPSPYRFQARELPGLGLSATATLPLDLAPGAGGSSLRFDFFYGPKDTETLRREGHALSRSVDLGWFSFIAHPLGYLLRLIYRFVGNYGVAIILVTVLIKMALWPLTAKSYRSMKKMQKISGPIQKLREKYKGDPASMNKEMMALYRLHGVNPLGGCLPMLLQIPFFFAFYRVLDYALELRGAPFMLWIRDLSAPDRLFSFDVSVPFLAPPVGIPVLTLLMGASMIWQQRMTPAMGDPMQAKMMMLLPLFFIVFLLNMPSGLVLYWLVNNVLSIAQQKLINRDPDAKAAPPAARPAAAGKRAR